MHRPVGAPDRPRPCRDAAADVPGKLSPAAEQALNVAQNDFFPLMLAGLGVVAVIRHGEPTAPAPAPSPT